jgi:hypothetical protein
MARQDGTASHGVSSAMLFLCPAILAFAAIAHSLSMRRAQGKPEAVQSVRSFSATLLLAMGAITASMQGIILGRSMGLALPYEAIARCGFVLSGLVMVVFGNRLPKLPWVTSSAMCLDDAGIQKIRRLNGLWLVFQGVIFVLAGLLLQPLRLALWVLPLTLGGVVAMIAYSFWLRQRQAGGAQ